MNIRSLQKHFLAGAMVIGMVLNSQAQFTITGTSISFTGNTVPTTGAGRFYNYQPNNGGSPNVFYIENTCTTAGTQGNPGDVGGFDPNYYDATSVTPAHSAGVITYGGKIRTVYYGTPCAAQHPSFGFHTGTTGIADGSDVDLSNTGNQKLEFTYQSNANITLVVQLLDASYTGKLNGNETVTLVGDNTPHTISLDFSDNLVGGADMTNVRQLSFEYQNDVASPDFGISLSDIKLGSVLNGTSKASENIASSVVYPNPSSEGNATVDLKLKTVSDVKIILSDLMGKEVAVIAEEKTASLSKPFSVEGLVEGVYTVNYYINGAPAKSELLMVR